jgi:hypothetical protein
VKHGRGSHAAKLPAAHRALAHAAFALSWVSGAVVLWARYWGRGEGPFGPERHPGSRPPPGLSTGWRRVSACLAVGSLLTRHVPAGWATGQRRPSAILLLAPVAGLALSGWGLYYAGHEGLRRVLEIAHAALGFLLPLPLLVHARRAAVAGRPGV